MHRLDVNTLLQVECLHVLSTLRLSFSRICSQHEMLLRPLSVAAYVLHTELPVSIHLRYENLLLHIALSGLNAGMCLANCVDRFSRFSSEYPRASASFVRCCATRLNVGDEVKHPNRALLHQPRHKSFLSLTTLSVVENAFAPRCVTRHVRS